MSELLRALPGFEPCVAVLRRFTYGPGYESARDEVIKQADGICRYCGRRKATQAHHRALHYPPDWKVTAADLIAVCAPCHCRISFRRLLDRAGDPGMCVILATGLESGYPESPRDALLSGGRRCGARHRTRSLPRPGSGGRARGPKGRALDPWSLVVRCHLVLVVGCLGCDRFVRLDTLEPFRRGRWPGSVADLRRRLCCCRCRSRTRWILLGLLAAGRNGRRRPARFPLPGLLDSVMTAGVTAVLADHRPASRRRTEEDER